MTVLRNILLCLLLMCYFNAAAQPDKVFHLRGDWVLQKDRKKLSVNFPINDTLSINQDWALKDDTGILYINFVNDTVYTFHTKSENEISTDPYRIYNILGEITLHLYMDSGGNKIVVKSFTIRKIRDGFILAQIPHWQEIDQGRGIIISYKWRKQPDKFTYELRRTKK